MDSTTPLDIPPPPAQVEPEASTSTLEPSAPSADPPLSKTAQKRLAKKAALAALRPARRAAEKSKKKAKAVEKRKLVELGVIERDSTAVEKRRARNGKKVLFGAKVVVDLAFDDKMTDKEIASMRNQLSTCYAVNRLSTSPVPLIYTSFNGKLKADFDAIGTSHEAWNGIEWWEEGYEGLWADPVPTTITAVKEGETTTTTVDGPLVKIGPLKGNPRARTDKSSIIYLSGDSPNILTSIDPTKTYIIGGIVDKNRYKSLCLDKAISQGIAHAQLPLAEYLPTMGTRKVLTVNHVVEIIVKWIEMRDWEQAFMAVMPQRKFKVDENNESPKAGPQKSVYVAQDGEDDEEEEGDVEIITEEVVAKED